MDYSELRPGQQLPTHRHKLSPEAVQSYIEAVDDGSSLYGDAASRRLVPPTAIAALAIRGVLEDLAIPGGTIHAGQELSFMAAAEVGQELTCRATVTQNSVRGQWRFISVDLSVEDTTGQVVIKGKSSIMIPA